MKSVAKITNLINQMITVDPDMSVTKIAVLLEIYNKVQTTPTKLAEDMNLTLATASRHIAYWSDWNRQRKEGKGAIEYSEDRMDRRIRYISCTLMGKQLVESLSKVVE